jgi:purine-binding chemotaxis protein CheW
VITLEQQKIELGEKKVLDVKQFIVTKIGKEQYGINIQYVNNIVRMQKITRVPKAQYYYKGVINLRGEIIPIMSLRLKFELEEIEYTKDTRIIIVKTDKQNSVGIIVDAVSEVVTLDEEHMEKPTVDGSESRMQYIAMLGKHEGTLISIINIGSIISEID